MSAQAPYAVGQVVNGHVWTGSTWIALLQGHHPQTVPYPMGWAPTPPGYAAYYTPPGYPVAPRSYNGLAIASFVTAFLWWYGIGSLAAVIMGAFSLAEIKRTGERGQALAIAGIVIGAIGIVGTILFILILIIGASNPTYGALGVASW